MNPERLERITSYHRGLGGGDPGFFDRRGRSLTRSPVAWVHAGWLVVGATLTLWLIGVYCIGLTNGLDGPMLSGTAVRQLVFGGLGIVAGAVVAVPHFRRYVYLAWPMAAGVILLLVIVLLPFVPEEIVRPRKGARRWINVGITEFQPSELAKIAYVLVTASWLRFRRNHRRLKGLVVPALLAIVPMALILVEPDLGTAMLFLPAAVAMLLAAGARLKHLISTAVLGGAFAAAVVVISLVAAQAEQYPLLRPHQVERIQAVMDSFRGDDRFVDDRGFQGRQAITLIGAGGATGNDEDHARALVYFSRLPERHNDMIFAVFATRFGLAGIMVLLGLYAVWIAGALWVGAAAQDPFGRLVAVGLAALVATQMGINVGMTVGLLPITGMTLPFVSAGGSSLVAGFIMVGLIVNVGLRRPRYQWGRRSFEFDDE